jgi:hypothetical protein
MGWTLGCHVSTSCDARLMTDNPGPRRIPINTLRGPNDQVTEHFRQLPYLRELKRQATIFNDNVENAWRRALGPTNAPDDLAVWASLQAALFAAIVVQRLLRPSKGSVRKQPHHSTRGESQALADARGERLRTLLEVPDNAIFFTVTKIRDAFEHVDERYDGIMRDDVVGFSDWYITDGMASVTLRPSDRDPTPEHVSHGLRVFFPAAGALYFDDNMVDLYLLDLAMLDMREMVTAKGSRDSRADVRPRTQHVRRQDGAVDGFGVGGASSESVDA